MTELIWQARRELPDGTAQTSALFLVGVKGVESCSRLFERIMDIQGGSGTKIFRRRVKT